MVINLDDTNTVGKIFLTELRDAEIQKDSMRFRRNVERLSEILAYEISKQLLYTPITVQTPLSEATGHKFKNNILIASILRAGLPMHTGFLNTFDKAENAFISAYRMYNNDGSFEIKFEYLSSPEIDKKIVILVDPMLATGSSMIIAYKGLLEKGTPLHTHFVSIIASREGIEYVKQFIVNDNATIWTAAIDDDLTAKGYIVPGLGDAGDLAYGQKS